MGEQTILCVANHYEQKYYFNPEFSLLPAAVQEELQIMCVFFTEEVGGILELAYDEDGSLKLSTISDPDDIMYDEIGAGLYIKKLQEEKKELFSSLELFYQVFAEGGI